MASSKGYYIRPTGRTSIPRCVIGVHVVPRPATGVEQTAVRRVSEIDHVITSHSLYSWSGWSPIQTIAHGTHHAFWDWLEDEGWQRRKIYLFAPDATASLTLIRWWDRLESMGMCQSSLSLSNATSAEIGGYTTSYRIHTLVNGNRTTIVDYSRSGVRYIWTSLTQYLPLSMREIAEMVGMEWHDGSEVEIPQAGEDRQSTLESVLTVRAVQHLADFWRTHKGGPWATSIGGLAARFLRSRLQSRTVCTHTHAAALEIERSACFGGRVSCWYVGDVASSIRITPEVRNRPPRSSYPPVGGPVYDVDVRSMYPHILSCKVFPMKFLGCERSISGSDLADLLRYICIVARVSIKTDEAEYPYRCHDAVYYPTGEFVTTLCGPELDYAIRRNHLVSVHGAALYQSGTPFVGAALELLAARTKDPHGRDSPSARIVKLLSNALTGTFAQRRTEWVPCPGAVPPHDEFGEQVRWGPFSVSTPDRQWDAASDPRYAMMTGDVEAYRPRIVSRYRVVAGLVERLSKSETGTGTLQACYAYLTSYGRSMMRDIRAICPEKSVLLQDTDGLWVTEQGHDALASHAGTYGSLPGDLIVKRRIQLARIYTPKHYWCDGKWTLGGFHNPEYDPRNHTVTDTRSSNPMLGTPKEAPWHVVEFTRESELLLQHLHGHQGADGWITPYHISEGVKPRPVDHLRSDDDQ